MTTIEEKITRVLVFQTEPISAKRISQLTKANYSSVRGTLRRMVAAETVQQTGNGLYASMEKIIADTGLLKERLRMHGIKLESQCNTMKRGLSFEATRNVTTGAHRHRRNKSIVYTEEWMERKITITHHIEADKAEVWLQSGDNDLEFSEFIAFTSFIQGRFPRILLSEWEVTMLGINWDTDRIRLQGVQKVSLQQFQDLWINIYQRETGKVRVEAHTTRKINLAELLETLSIFVNIVDNPLVTR